MAQVIDSGRLIPWSEAVDLGMLTVFFKNSGGGCTVWFLLSLPPPPAPTHTPPHSCGRLSYVEVFTQLSLGPALFGRE